MKRIVSLLLAMLMLCCAVTALAEGREAPENRKDIVTELDGGIELHFKNPSSGKHPVTTPAPSKKWNTPPTCTAKP